MPNCVGHSKITVSNVSINLATGGSTTMPNTARGCQVTVETDQVRYREDGTAPTSSTGHLLNSGDIYTCDSWSRPNANWDSLMRLTNFIRVTGDATLMVSWYE
jgi:hypothetical protein